MKTTSLIALCAPLAIGMLAVPTAAQDQDNAQDDNASDAATPPQADADAVAQARRPGGGHSKQNFLKTYDTNGDGQVSLGEFVVKREEGYARRDADGDGSLTKDEYVGEFVARMDERMAQSRQRQIDAANFRFGFMDSDENAVMTATEFHASGSRMFKRLDTNEDGVVNDADTSESF